MSAQNGGPKPGKPHWVSPGNLSSDTGYGLLEWEQKPGESVDIFRLKEKFNGLASYSYVVGRKLSIYRSVPGQYEFQLSACIKDHDGYPSCGAQSSSLNFVVTQAIYDPYLVSADDFEAHREAASATADASGGPTQLRPGIWYNPAKSGHGWSFYWANRLALSSNPQNAYDLYGIWYTFEAKTRVITPICEPPDPPCGFETELYNYRPLVATMQLVKTGSTSFGGSIYVTRNGTAFHEGSATISFSGNETSATVTWNADFQHESLNDQDDIFLLVGEDTSPFSDPTNFAGLWDPDNGADYYIIDDIGTTAELVEVVFYDDDGDPVWIEAGVYRSPSEYNTSLCFYYIAGGYAPDINGSIPANWFTSPGCDHNEDPNSSNRNGRRYFSDYETGRYWVNFTLPAGAGGNAPAGGSVSIGSTANPAYFSKQANFHRIYLTDGNSCDISDSVASCNAVVTWFTDGDYPDATAFVYQQSNGQRSIIATSTQPVMENRSVSLAVAGDYVFELRMSNSSSARLIAESQIFTVNEIQDVMLTPTGLSAAWTNETGHEFEVAWSHADIQAVEYYILEEDDPTSDPVEQYTVSPGSVLNRDFTYPSGPWGSYRYRVRACSTSNGPEVCSTNTAWMVWQLEESTGTTARPWGDNDYGTTATDVGWDYAMGYHFTTTENGSVTELGGLFNGTKTVKLFQRGGAELARVDVTSSNAWSYKSIPPVAITAGVEYTVAAYMSGSGASYRSGSNFPQTFGQVEILASTYARTSSDPDAVPDATVSLTTMYGQVDIGFEAGGQPQSPPVISPLSDQQATEGDSPSLQVIATDADGTVVSFDAGASLPAGLTINNAGLISGTIASGAAANSPHSVTITATDNDGLTGQETFTWNVTQGTVSSNPENPPDPAGPPDMGVDAISSGVGLTKGVFGVDESGSATFSVPVFTAPGSGGLAPQISLEYSSQGRNGPLGVGGSLGGLSAITRCGQTLVHDGPGRVRGISLSNSDRFCLDGQRLIAVAGEYGADGTQYRSEIDGFAKIVSSGIAGSGPAYFTVWRKDGSVAEYGNTADSRIEARTSLDVQTALTWAQNRLTDPAGNYIDTTYFELAGSAGELIEFVPDSIRYTGNERAGTTPYAELNFIYSSNRPDTTVKAVAGAMIAQSQLLVRVDSRARANAGSSLETLRSYVLAYGTDGHGRQILESISECRDSSQTTCFEPTRFDWHKSKHEIGASSVEIGDIFSAKHVALAMADINGDGRPDLLLTEKSKKSFRFRIATALASGGFSSPGSTTYTIPNNGSSNEPVILHTMDLNADGFQDVIYPTSSNWKARLSNGSSLGNEITVSGDCCGMSDPPLVRIMDFDGDGLPDLVTNKATATPGNQLVLLRNKFSASNSSAVGFEPSQAITIASSENLFPVLSAGGWQIVDEQPHFYDQAGNSAKFTRPFDYNGDGAVDLLVRLSQKYVKCSSNCDDLSNETASGSISQFTFDREPLASTQSTTYSWVTFYVVLVSDGGTSFVQHEVVAVGEDCIVYDACNPYSSAPVARRVLPVDINADGLADFAYQDEQYDWKARINLGGEFYPADIPVATFSDDEQGDLSRFHDLSGDGYPEFIYPSAVADSNAVWIVHDNQFGSAFAGPRTTNNRHGDSDGGGASILLDVNGDRMVDNLFIDIDSRGRVRGSSTRVYLGRNVAGGNTTQAGNLVTAVTDGFGASTAVSYKPLTDNTVYTRMRDSKNADWDGGHAVYDLIAPIFVVSEVQSSAPVFGNAQAMSRIEYHYIGAKLQGGGRGFLGFGEVISYDPQSGIRSNTRYRQDFPFTGLPADTTRALAGNNHKFDPLSNPASSAPRVWAGVSATTVAPDLGSSGILLSYTVNQWDSIATVAGQAAVFPFVRKTLQRNYTMAGNFNHKVLTSNSHDGFGNLTRVVVDTYASDGTEWFATQSSNHEYFSADTANWRLGQLSRSTVSHQRSGEPSITRTSAFSYDSVTGILDQEVIEPDNNAFMVTTLYQLDSFGNRTASTVTGYGMAPRSRSSNFDPLGRFVLEAYNAYNQRVQKTSSWDAFGNALAVENIDGVKTIVAADDMGRPFINYTETGAWSKTIRRNGSGSYCPAGETVFHSRTSGGGQPEIFSCFDLLGRELRTAAEGFDGTMVYVDYYYDESGLPERTSEPYYAGDARYWNRTAYDELGRIEAVLAADGNDQTYDYNEAAGGCISGQPRQTLITNGLGQSRLEVRNALGETTAVFDNDCGEVSYAYDAMGKLTRVSGVDGATSTTAYDLAGRKVNLDDPDKGYWQYAYNPLGELTRQLDSKNQALDFVYDKLGRVTNRRELSSVSSLVDSSYNTVNHETSTWNNNTSTTVMGKGLASKVIYRSGESGAVVHQRESSYDSFGRLAVVSITQDGLQLAEETTYDQFGRLFQQFDASGDDHGIRYHYTSRGYVEKLQEAREGTNGVIYQHILGMDARARVTSLMLGNGVEAFASYQAQSGRIEVLEAYDVQGVELQFVTYRFDVAGNLESRHDTSRAGDLDESFSYDGLNRLEQVMLAENGAAAQSTLSIQYDDSGNITYKSDVGNYLYGQGGAGPHAVTNAGGVSYTYDNNGNQLTGDGRTISYRVFDQAMRIEKGSQYTEFAYGIGNQRIKRLDNNAIDEIKTTWYFGGVERIEVQGENAFFKRYLGGVAIADYYPVTGQQSTTYLIRDHLGSIHTTVNETGLVLGSTAVSFGAFGERRDANGFVPISTTALMLQNMMTTRGFTGHEHADGLGVIHMNGRIYDPKLGRFLQADPVVQSPKNSQSLNRYTYVYNNPLSYTDPSGYFSLKRFVKRWGRLIVAVVVSYITYGAASGWAAGWLAGTTLAGNSIAIGSIAGAISGFVGGAIISGSLNGAVTGAFAGAIMGGVAGYFNNSYSAQRIAADGIAGGISAELNGQKFKDGLLFTALVSSVTYISVRLRAYQKLKSEQFPGQIGESEGFRGIEGKLTGERIYEDLWVESGAAKEFADNKPLDWIIKNKYIPAKKNLSPLGGLQGSNGLLFGKTYRPGGFIDYILEGYSGVHDTLNQPYFYTANGTNRTITSNWQKYLGYLINPVNVVFASPLVLPSLLPDYLRHFYFQDFDR